MRGRRTGEERRKKVKVKSRGPAEGGEERKQRDGESESGRGGRWTIGVGVKTSEIRLVRGALWGVGSMDSSVRMRKREREKNDER